MEKYGRSAFGTQGGGLVRWDGSEYVFIEKPKCPGLEVGDVMPKDWGIGFAMDLEPKCDCCDYLGTLMEGCCFKCSLNNKEEEC